MSMPPSPERRSCGKAWPWIAVVEEFHHWVRARPAFQPLLWLSNRLAESASAPRLHPGVSYEGLLITDGPDFYRDDHVLFITFFPEQQQFRLQYRRRGQPHDECFATESDVLPKLSATLLRYFGIPFAYSPPPA